MHGLVPGILGGWRPGVHGLVLGAVCGWMPGVLGLVLDRVWYMLLERCRASRLFVSIGVAMGRGYEWQRCHVEEISVLIK